jgi:hypothetical protein
MTWPTTAVVTTNTDQSTDSPATARADILQAMQNVNSIMTHIGGAEVTLASAATTDIGNQASNRISLTGTATITSLGTTYSGPVFVRIAAGGAPVFTHDATALITPLGVTFTGAAGDCFIAYPKATAGTADGWIMANYERASGAPLNELAEVSVASAATTDIGSAKSSNLLVTGAVTITSLGTVAAGTVRKVRFSGAPLLTYNATSLILPGAANIQAAAGDCAEFESLGSGNWVCRGYSKVDGTALQGLAASNFTGANQSLATSGFQKLPGGMIIQWGVATASAATSGTSTTVTLPVAYASAAYVVTANATGSVVSNSTFNVTATNTTSFTVQRGNNGNAESGVNFHWISIGQ